MSGHLGLGAFTSVDSQVSMGQDVAHAKALLSKLMDIPYSDLVSAGLGCIRAPVVPELVLRGEAYV